MSAGRSTVPTSAMGGDDRHETGKPVFVAVSRSRGLEVGARHASGNGVHEDQMQLARNSEHAHPTARVERRTKRRIDRFALRRRAFGQRSNTASRRWRTRAWAQLRATGSARSGVVRAGAADGSDT